MQPLTLNLFRAGTAAASVVPRPVANALSRGLGAAAVPFLPERRILIERNIDRATGHRLSDAERAVMVREALQSYARYWEDLLRLPNLDIDELSANFSHDGLEHIGEGLDRGVGVVLALPHVGRWEWAAAWLTRVYGVQVTAVVEPIQPPELFEWFRQTRESLGINVVPLGPEAVPALTNAIVERHVVCLLCDRDLTGGGPEVDFFGETTSLPAGPVVMALRSGAALLPTAVYEAPGNRVLGMVRPPMQLERTARMREDVCRLTQDLAHELEVLISAEPPQWHLQTPNWPSDYEALAAAGYPAEPRPPVMLDTPN